MGDDNKHGVPQDFKDFVFWKWVTEHAEKIVRLLEALHQQGEQTMAKVVELIAQADASRDEILAAVSTETAEIAAILAAQQAAFQQLLADTIANGDFVTPEQMADQAAKGAAVVAAIQGISDALATVPPAP